MADVTHYCNFAGLKQQKCVLSSGGQEVGRAVLPLEALGGNLFVTSPGFQLLLDPWAFFGLWLHHARLVPVLILPSVCASNVSLLSLTKTFVMAFRVHLSNPG